MPLNNFPIDEGTLTKVLLLLGLFVLAWIYFRLQNKALKSALERAKKGESGMGAAQIHSLNKLITAFACFTLLILTLKALGYDASMLLTIGGIGGAFVGFATKDFIANFFGGLVIYLTRPFTLGDMIKFHKGEVEGRVEDIGWYLTTIIDNEKQPVHIPNSMFSQVILITPSKRSHHRIKEVFQVRPQDIDKVSSIIEDLKQALSELPDIDSRERLEVYYLGGDRFQLNIEILAYTKEIKPHKYKEVIQKVLFKARECLAKQGAEVPGSTTEISFLNPPSRPL